MLAPLIFLCVVNANVGLAGSKQRYERFFHDVSFLLSVLLIVWSGEWVESIVSVALAYLLSFISIYFLFSPWEGAVENVDLIMHLVCAPLAIFFFFPRYVPETDFALGRPLTLVITSAFLAIHFILHRPRNQKQRHLYIFWFVTHAVTLLFF